MVGDKAEDDLYRYAKLVSLFGVAQVANSIRVSVAIPRDTKQIPANMYGVLLAPSGVGKSKSVGFVNDLIKPAIDVVKEKAQAQMEILDPFASEEIHDLTKDGVTVSDSYKSLTDAATVKIMRVLDLIEYFSINYIVDEFASVVTKEYEMLSSTVLEIYDKGYVPVNLRATSKINKAESPIPMNLLAFGSAHLLFESDTATEKAFFDLLLAGLARRSVFCYVDTQVNRFTLDVNANRNIIDSISNDLVKIVSDYDKKVLSLSSEAESAYLKYLDDNTEDSLQYQSHLMLQKIYAKNKYWIALKLSALVAVSNFHEQVELSDFEYAKQIVEDSEKDLHRIINRPQKYELVVDYLVESGKEESEYTLTQSLPFYKEIKAKKQFLELMKGYAFDNNITLMIQEKHNVTFYSAKNREKVDLDKPLTFSYSSHITEGFYCNDQGTWKDFYKVVCADGIHYSAHCFKDGYRKKDNVIEGFSLIILDFDGGVSLDTAKLIFEDYTYLIATTKSHQVEKNGIVDDRFRVILPMESKLELDPEQYSQFMKNLLDDIPIEADRACVDASRFYYSYKGEYWYNEGVLFDAIKYIPNTQEAETYSKEGNKLSKKNIDRIGQYLLRNEHSGRNNQLLRYSLLLIDKGYSKEDIKKEVLKLNAQFSKPLPEVEIERSVFVTLENRYRDVDVVQDEVDDDDPFSSIDEM